MQCALCAASCVAEPVAAITLDRRSGCHASPCPGLWMMTASAWQGMLATAERELGARRQRVGVLDGVQLILEILGAGFP